MFNFTCKVKEFRKGKNNSVFKFIFSSYFLLCILIFVVFIVPFHSYYKKIIIKQNYEKADDLLFQVYTTNLNTMEWTTNYAQHFSRDVDIFNLLYNGDVSKLEAIKSKSKLKNISDGIPFIHSIYIYNGQSKKFYSSLSGEMTIDEFYDQGIIPIIENRTSYMPARPIGRKLNIVIDNKPIVRDVITILAGDYPMKDSLDESIIIVNLSQKYFSTLINQESDYHSELLVFDEQKQLIGQSNEGDFLKDLSGHQYINKISNDNQQQDNFIDIVNDQKALVSYVKSSKLGLTFVSITNYSELMSGLSTVTILFWVIAILIFIIGVVWSYWFSSKIASPIIGLADHLRQRAVNEHTSDGLPENKTLEDLISGIQHTIDQLDTSEKGSSEVFDLNDRIFMKKQILKGVLLNLVHSTGNEELLEYPQLNTIIELNNICVAAIGIENYNDFINTRTIENQKLYIFAITNIAHEIISQVFPCEIVHMHSKYFAIIMNISHDVYIKQFPKLEDTLNHLIEATNQYLAIDIGIGIGSYVLDFHDIYKSYDIAIDCLEYNFYRKDTKIYSQYNIPEIVKYKYPSDIETLLFESIKEKDKEKVTLHLNSFVQELTQSHHSFAKEAIEKLIRNSIHFFKSINLQDESFIVQLKGIEINTLIINDIFEVKQEILNIYIKFIVALENIKATQRSDMIENTLTYIVDNVHDSTLSVAGIADYVGISTNYLRTIFKDEMNESLSTYINEIRFGKAKEMMENTDLPIKDIAEKIGFTNPSYFYTSFKKIYGITPNQYRTNSKQKS